MNELEASIFRSTARCLRIGAPPSACTGRRAGERLGLKGYDPVAYFTDGKPAKLKLGSVNLDKAASGEPVIGGPLTLAEARALCAEINRQRASGRDVVSEIKAVKQQHRRANAGQTDTFAEVAQAFIEKHKVKKTGERPRGWRDVAKMLGLA